MSPLEAADPPEWFIRAVADEPSRSWVDVEGAAIEMLTWGPVGAPGVLFTHGARAHADWWSHLLPLLAQGRRIACLSWSGMGRSGWRERYTLEQYVREAMAVAQAAGLFEAPVKPMIVGHSFGGYMAAIAAAEHGARLRGVVIVDSSIRPNASAWPEITLPRVYKHYEDARRRFRFAPPQPAEPWITDWLAQHALMLIEGGWAWRFDPEIYRKLAFRSLWDAIARPACPLVFMRGERSAVVTPGLAALQQAQAPEGTPYIVVEDAYHHLMADQPLALVEALERLIA